ncbi:MAG: serine/threonine protein kinase, partial [Fimbriiglobus sp.]
MTGARVGPWVLGAEIGNGPVGAVYRATDRDDPDRTAAVKLLTHETTRAAGFLDRFPAEMLALHRLNHPNIAKFYDSGVSNGTAYFAAELVDGVDLGTLLRTRPRKPDEPGLPWKDELFRLAVQIARGLKHGHHRSLLHRDLKPSNVLVAADGTVK